MHVFSEAEWLVSRPLVVAEAEHLMGEQQSRIVCFIGGDDLACGGVIQSWILPRRFCPC
ncbi:hypothetical protein ACFXPZ_01555 [Streptomyces sp. NPDC059101]|uniref:hypothetical protein n=1 Tax=Streptomyces sp. NPDC059101 TaxID=3346728 RepID=UPI00367D2EBD